MGKEPRAIGRIITSAECIAEGAEWLAAKEPRFGAAYRNFAPLALRLRAGGYTQLLSAIVSQQLSVASARSIWTRLEEAQLTTPEAMIKADEALLRACGLSGPKQRYAKALAMADIDYAGLENLPDEDVVKTLTAIPGIGNWTAEVYAMFSLGRADAFAAGDLALQEGARHLFELDARPSEKALRALSQNWRPWRSVAARLLWDHYRFVKEREGIA